MLEDRSCPACDVRDKETEEYCRLSDVTAQGRSAHTPWLTQSPAESDGRRNREVLDQTKAEMTLKSPQMYFVNDESGCQA